MAGLKKPEQCNICDSRDLHREFHPERWVCNNNHIIIARLPKAITGICHNCKRTKSAEVPFKDGKNSCLECYNKYMIEWYSTNHDREKAKKRGYYKKNRIILRGKSDAYWQSTPERFIACLMRRCTVCAVKKMSGEVRKVPFVCTICRQDLLDLWVKQGGKCAITGLLMDYKWNLLTSISVDRIDSKVGYVPGNVHLVCKGINIMKGAYSVDEVKAFLRRVVFQFV
jgi:hypothetical protein